MYQLIYSYRETIEHEVIEREYHSDEFRLKRNAVHYLREIVQSDYREMGYGTEMVTSNKLCCYKSEITPDKKRKIMEYTIKVEKA